MKKIRLLALALAAILTLPACGGIGGAVGNKRGASSPQITDNAAAVSSNETSAAQESAPDVLDLDDILGCVANDSDFSTYSDIVIFECRYPILSKDEDKEWRRSLAVDGKLKVYNKDGKRVTNPPSEKISITDDGSNTLSGVITRSDFREGPYYYVCQGKIESTPEVATRREVMESTSTYGVENIWTVNTHMLDEYSFWENADPVFLDEDYSNESGRSSIIYCSLDIDDFAYQKARRERTAGSGTVYVYSNYTVVESLGRVGDKIVGRYNFRTQRLILPNGEEKSSVTLIDATEFLNSFNKADAEMSGRFSDSIKWYYLDNILVVKGEGEMPPDPSYISQQLWHILKDAGLRQAVHRLIIEDGITIITGFAELRDLEYVSIPDSVTVIADYAFSNCERLQEITLPSSVAWIGKGAFAGSGLTGIVIPDSVPQIVPETFAGCSDLTSVQLSDHIGAIGEGAFRSCTSLTGIQLPGRLQVIGSRAFQGCSSLETIEIPVSVNTIGSAVFEDTESLSEIALHENMGPTAYLYNKADLYDLGLPSSVTIYYDGSDFDAVAKEYPDFNWVRQ